MVANTKTKKAKASTEAPIGAPRGAAPGPEGQAPQPDLSIGDLRNLSTVIDVASTRGAFRANEMAMVGATFNKLDGFLKIVEKSQKDANKKPEDQATAEKK